jgi:transposase-like protein
VVQQGRRLTGSNIRPRVGSIGRATVAKNHDRRQFWRNIAEGMSSEEAATCCGVSSPVGSRWFRESGGMRSISLTPPSSRYLSFAEREDIAMLRAHGEGVREIARQVGRSASTISRELRRNAATARGYIGYRASTAQWHCERRARRPKPAKLASHDALRYYVQDRLSGAIVDVHGNPIAGPTVSWKRRRHGPRQDRRWTQAWSPEQIAQRLVVDFPHDGTIRISHEAIYQALYVQGRGALRRELTACLRTGRALRVP